MLFNILTVAYSLGKDVEEVEAMSLEMFETWLAYFKVVNEQNMKAQLQANKTRR